MVPSRSSLPALTAFARPGPVACRSPTSSLVFGHPTPSTSSAPAFAGRPPVFPWASLPRVDASSACRTARAVTPAAQASSWTARRRLVAGPPWPGCVPRGRSRVSQVTGVSSCYVLQSNIPPVPRELAISPPGDAAFQTAQRPPHRDPSDFGTATLRPALRLPTHQPSRYRDSCKVGYRPAG